MVGLNPSEMDIKVFIPAVTFYLQFKKYISWMEEGNKFP